jgi:hypothetical protein
VKRGGCRARASRQNAAGEGLAYTSRMRLKPVTLWALISMILLTILIFSDFVVVLVGYVRAPRELLGLFTAAVHLLASASVTAFFYTSYRNRR